MTRYVGATDSQCKLPSTTSSLRTVMYVNSKWVCVSQGQTIYTSTDGLSWDSVSMNLGKQPLDMDYGNGTYVVAGGQGLIATSTDLTTWTTRTSGTTENLNGVGYGSTHGFVVVGNNGVILTSSDGATWTTQTSGTTSVFQDVHWCNPLSLWVAVGNSGTLRTSTDTVTWTSRTISGTYLDVTYDSTNSLLIAVGGSAIATSPNGTTWTNRTPATTGQSNAIECTSSICVTAGSNGIQTSTNGTTWSARSVNSTEIFQSVSFGNNLWVAVGNNGRTAVSSNAIDWVAQ